RQRQQALVAQEVAQQGEVFVVHYPAPNSAPAPAVRAMARAPQKVTRSAPLAAEAPPARAAMPPSTHRETRAAPATIGDTAPGGAKAAVTSGSRAPMANVPAEVSAA